MHALIIIKVVHYRSGIFILLGILIDLLVQIGVVTGIALAIVLGMSFSSIAGLFSKDPEVLQIVRKGVLVSDVYT